MAAIKSSSLKALTAAALLLPLLNTTTAHADDSEADFQYSHYQEGQRQLYGVTSKFDPIEVDSLHGSVKLTLAERIKFAFNYAQDTWTGATPITTMPLAFGGNRPRQLQVGKNIVVSGATPMLQPNGAIFVDKNFNPISYNPFAKGKAKFVPNSQLVHTLSSASPETRQQADFKLGYEWQEAALNVGGGISVERDYESRFLNVGGYQDFNHKLTRISAGLSYTNSATFAKLDHDAVSYIKQSDFFKQHVNDVAGSKILHGRREDWAMQLGLTQVLNKNALVDFGFGYTRSAGYMANPYKVMEVLFVDPNQLRDPYLPANILTGDVRAFLEQRPELRNQWNLNARYVQHIEPLDAALHLDYRFFLDDWGIQSHTFELAWAQPLEDDWQITPRMRYYSQTAANFYQPYLLSKQSYNPKNLNALNLPTYFSSDQRLSGYGALSGGVTVSKKFARGLTLEAGFEYYTHQGDLKLGGNGEGRYADFDSYSVNAALKVNLENLANAKNHAEHPHHAEHHHVHPSAPAGVMFDHTLKQGEMMVGYRYMRNWQAGKMLHGDGAVNDRAIRVNACGQKKAAFCSITASEHSMQMHMMDIMYAPTDWLTLMLMPQFMDMDMNFRQLAGAAPSLHAGHGHSTGGIGDTSVYGLVKVFESPEHHLHFAAGFSAPTGDVGIKLRPNHGHDPGFIHYGMQLGSGTWDFKPSITYTGQQDAWSWGAQVSGTLSMEKRNQSGFAFGDSLQATAWSGYQIFDWLSASVRGIYSTQGRIQGEYNEAHDQASPLDYPANYGGQYWDVGFGLNAKVTGGEFAGHHLAFEWLQPVAEKVNGYQLERDGALSLSWGYAF